MINLLPKINICLCKNLQSKFIQFNLLILQSVKNLQNKQNFLIILDNQIKNRYQSRQLNTEKNQDILSFIVKTLVIDSMSFLFSISKAQIIYQSKLYFYQISCNFKVNVLIQVFISSIFYCQNSNSNYFYVKFYFNYFKKYFNSFNYLLIILPLLLISIIHQFIKFQRLIHDRYLILTKDKFKIKLKNQNIFQVIILHSYFV
ncbi:hypothetical protein ABPG74_021376 [Tetrahymena malaccensis]